MQKLHVKLYICRCGSVYKKITDNFVEKGNIPLYLVKRHNQIKTNKKKHIFSVQHTKYSIL